MKSRERFLFSIVLLLLNVTGAAGALLDSLGVVFGETLLPAPFLWGMFVMCLLSAVLWSTRNKLGMAVQWLLLFLVCFVGIVLFWHSLAEGLGLVLQGVFEQLNARYGIHLIWNFSKERDSILWQATWSVLVFMLLYVLLIGYAVVRERALALVLADSIWFAAACIMDDFPAYVWLVLCVLGLAAVLIRRSFRDDERAGIQAVLIGLAVLGAVMAPLYRFGVPFLDSKYEALLEARIELNRRINKEWIPGLQRMLAGFGFGEGTDVTGSLTRDTGTMYTAAQIYRVTYSHAPKSTVYLRGFVGKDYAGDEWEAAGDSDLEKYYREKGLELPENEEELINLTYEVFHSGDFGSVTVEELAAPGSYTIYPYGARISEDYKSHWDGTVERTKGRYELQYSAPEDYRPEQALTGTLAETEAGYRAYVYDSFCEYPEDQLPELMAFMEQSEFRTDSVYYSLIDVLAFLRGNAVYDLSVPNTPEGEDFVEYFLFESKRGYCAHFASSAVLMLRYLGVPARYAAGYAAAPESFKRNQDGTYSTVILDRQAHAWAEVYLEGIGWVPVEMTPGAVPFPRNNGREQLELVGELTGRPEEDNPQYRPASSSVETPKAEKPVDEGSDENDKPGEPGDREIPERDELEESVNGESSEKDKQGGRGNGENLEKDQPGEPGDREIPERDELEESVNGESSEKDKQGGRGNGENSEGDQSEGPGSAENFESDRPGVSGGLEEFRQKKPIRVPKGVLMSAGVLVFFLFTKKMIRRLDLRRLKQAGNREKVFLLYGNTKRLMWAAGFEEKISCKESEGQNFNRLLEKCTFGEQEPTEEELGKVWNFCQGLEKKVYRELPFYKKLLFLGLDRFGLCQFQASGKRQNSHGKQNDHGKQSRHGNRAGKGGRTGWLGSTQKDSTGEDERC